MYFVRYLAARVYVSATLLVVPCRSILFSIQFPFSTLSACVFVILNMTTKTAAATANGRLLAIEMEW